MDLKSLFTTCLLLVIASTSFAAPQVSAPEKTFAFGELFQGDKVTHAFTFSNSGDEPLIIEKVRSSCGCTAAIVSKKTLQPGESGEISATFDSHRFRGPVSKKIYLYSNDPQQKTFEFGLTATVKELLVSTPHRISAGPIQTGQQHSTTIELTNQGNTPLTVTEIKVQNQLLKTELDRATLPPGETARLSINITPDNTRRKISSYVIVHTDSPKLPELRIPVFYLVNLGN